MFSTLLYFNQERQSYAVKISVIFVFWIKHIFSPGTFFILDLI